MLTGTPPPAPTPISPSLAQVNWLMKAERAAPQGPTAPGEGPGPGSTWTKGGRPPKEGCAGWQGAGWPQGAPAGGEPALPSHQEEQEGGGEGTEGNTTAHKRERPQQRLLLRASLEEGQRPRRAEAPPPPRARPHPPPPATPRTTPQPHTHPNPQACTQQALNNEHSHVLCWLSLNGAGFH